MEFRAKNSVHVSSIMLVHLNILVNFVITREIGSRFHTNKGNNLQLIMMTQVVLMNEQQITPVTPSFCYKSSLDRISMLNAYRIINPKIKICKA